MNPAWVMPLGAKMAKWRQSLAVFLLCAFCVAGASCYESSAPAGVIAKVNGENIYLHSLQMLMDSRSGSLGIAHGPSLDDMQKNYMSALAIIIAQTLARQELAQKGINPDGPEYDHFRGSLDEDFNAESLDEVLNSASLRRDDWENLVKNSHAMEIFKTRVLQPSIRIGLDEIKHYYSEHKADFTLPELYNICLASSPDRENLRKWCAAKGNAPDAKDVRIQCLDTEGNELPDNFRGVKNLEPGQCSSLKEENDLWLGLMMRDKMPVRKVPLAEAYVMIENILLAQKQTEEFENWLAGKIASSNIEVAPAFNEIFAKFSTQGEKAE